VARCRLVLADRPGCTVVLADDYAGQTADCALSLDVIYHLVEDAAFDAYMRRLYSGGRRCVVVYSSNRVDAARRDGDHVRHRVFTDWVDAHAAEWCLWRHVPNPFPFQGDWRSGSFADFYIYRPAGDVGA
ncbi:MAG: hypothetical protein ABIX12_08330, partial [Rubrivivax sp.]